MANLLDYIEWRGDISFLSSPINEVDVVILSQLVMLDLSSCVPKKGGSIKQCAKKYFKNSPDGRYTGFIIPDMVNSMFKSMSQSNRFGEMVLKKYVKDIDRSIEVQFSALTVDAPGVNTRFVVFSGTDDTIIGWKEEFNLIYKTPTGAQKASIKYLNGAAEGFDGNIIVLGHSKGGHLAMYSAEHCREDVYDKIANIVNMDGPGLPEDDEKNCPRFERSHQKIVTYLPQGSVIGRLFEHGERFEIVKSEANGLFQHDCFSWQVKGTRFIREERFDDEGDGVDMGVRSILSGMTAEDREQFVEGLFGMLFATSCTTLTELAGINSTSMMMAYFRADNHSKKAFNKIMLKIFRNKYLRKCFLDTSKELSKINERNEEKKKEEKRKEELEDKKSLPPSEQQGKFYAITKYFKK